MTNETAARRIIEALKKSDPNNVLLQHLLEDLSLAIFGVDVVDGLNALERGYVASGRHIDAIKELRNRYVGSGNKQGTLSGARDVVVAYASKHGFRRKE